MNRRKFLKLTSIVPLFGTAVFSDDNTKNNEIFSISINGDLDDDLIILKATIDDSKIIDIYQMHNPTGKLDYNGEIYNIEHSPGFIIFDKEYAIKNDEIYCICLANEREEASLPRNKRIRTHYKSEKLLFNDQIFLPAFLPEKNSVPNYPLWFNTFDVPKIDRRDTNGDTYNYYNLFENTTVPFGIVVPQKGKIKISLFNQNNELMYTFDENVDTNVRNLKSNELKEQKIGEHPFTELNNILNIEEDSQIENNDYIETVIVEYKEKIFTIPMPYPLMYPNLIYAVSLN